MLRYQVNRCNEIGFKLLLLMVMMLVTWQALTPRPPDQPDLINDKLLHALVFLFLAAISDHAFSQTRFGLKKIALLLGYGALIEILQHFIPTRDFSLLDLLANGIGLLIYLIIARLLLVRDLQNTTSPEN